MQCRPRLSRPLALAASALAVFLTAGAPAYAATVLPLTLPDLVEQSDAIVLGRIVGAEVFVGEYARITTRWTVEVEQTLHGEPAGVIRFTQWTGELSGVVQHVPGDAVVVDGERVVLFLHGEGPDSYSLTALSQAKFSVVGTPTAVEIPAGTPFRDALHDGVLRLSEVRLRPPGSDVVVPLEWAERAMAGLAFYDAETGEVRESGVPSAMPLAVLVAAIRDASAALGDR